MFNFEKFDIKLDTEFIGREFLYFEEVDSTNSYLMKSDEDFEHGTLVLSELQLKGKGRLNRNWVSNANQNLTFSIILNEKLNKYTLPQLNLCAAYSLGSAIENLHQLDVNLKWPNDVLIRNSKIGGILIETTNKSNKLEKVVIGIGVNVNQPIFKGEFEIQPTSIQRELRREVSRERLLSEFLNIFEENLEILERNPSEILNAWKNKCKMIDSKVKIKDGKTVKVGKFMDIDNDGFLILKKNDDSLETIIFGDVSLREQD